MKKGYDDGVTLMEVLVSLLILSIMVGMASRFVSSGMNHPFVNTAVEPWMAFMERSHQEFQKLPPTHPLLTPGQYTMPFSTTEKPSDFLSYQMTVTKSADQTYKTAKFEALTQNGKTIEWRSHRQ